MSQEIVDEARKWIGTPFRHQGRLKNIACDCLGLIMGVAEELKLTTIYNKPFVDLDIYNYLPDADGLTLEKILDQNLNIKFEKQPGFIVLMQFDNTPNHLAILSNNEQHEFGLIHANSTKMRVVEHHLSKNYAIKIKKIYELNNLIK